MRRDPLFTRSPAEIEQLRSDYRRYREAREHNDAWAKAHGCADFKDAMKQGLQNVGRRAHSPPSNEEHLHEPA